MKLFTKYFLKVAVCFYVKRKENNIVEFRPRGWDGWIWTNEITESKSVALPLGYAPIFFMVVLRSTNRTSGYEL